MSQKQSQACIAFEGHRCIARGALKEVALVAKSVSDRPDHKTLLVFDEIDSRLVELDLRGTAEDVLGRLVLPADPENPNESGAQLPTRRGPGRPKLGVVAREVTLLPRHWAWLNSQPGSASVSLRKLIDQARRANKDQDRVRLAQDAAYRFISAIAGDLPGFEEASRALFASSKADFETHVAAWPEDLGDHALALAGPVFENEVKGPGSE
jgi:hypothetical protein